MSDIVKLEINQNIAFVSLNRPEKLNGLDVELMETLIKTAKTIKKDRTIRVVILKGEGKAFCSGLDIKKVMKNPLNIVKILIKPGMKITNIVQDVGYVWRTLPVPVIAVTHGFCYGGGFQIALGADFRYTTPDCQFSIMEMKYGLIPDMSGSVTLRELISIDLAKELTMTARIFSGEDAKEYGLVTKVCESPLEEAIQFAEELITKSPDALAYAKKLFNQSWVADDKTALSWETKLQKRLIGRWNQMAAVSQSLSKEPKEFHQRKR